MLKVWGRKIVRRWDDVFETCVPTGDGHSNFSLTMLN